MKSLKMNFGVSVPGLSLCLMVILLFCLAMPFQAFSEENNPNLLKVTDEYDLGLPEGYELENDMMVEVSFSLWAKSDTKNIYARKGIEIPEELKKTLSQEYEKLLKVAQKDVLNLTKKKLTEEKILDGIEKRLITLLDTCKKASADSWKKWLKAGKREEMYQTAVFDVSAVFWNGGESAPVPAGFDEEDKIVKEENSRLSVAKMMRFSPAFFTNNRQLTFFVSFNYELNVTIPDSLKHDIKQAFLLEIDKIHGDLKDVIEDFEAKEENDIVYSVGNVIEGLREVVAPIGDVCQKICDGKYNQWLKDNKKDPAYKQVSASKKTVEAYLGNGSTMKIVPPQPGAKAKSKLANNKRLQIESAFNDAISNQIQLGILTIGPEIMQ